MNTYKNTKTGSIFSSMCEINGGDWVKVPGNHHDEDHDDKNGEDDSE